MNNFEYARPANVGEAIGYLGASWNDAAVLAGGTDLITSLKQQVASPKRLVSLRDCAELKGIVEENGRLKVGAMTTLAEIAENELVNQHFGALAAAAQGVGSPQIMSAGTIGGDLLQRPRCWYYRTGHGLLGTSEGKALIPEGDNRYHAIFSADGPAYFVCPSSFAPALIALDASVVLTGPENAQRELKVAELFRTPAAEEEREHAIEPNEVLTAVLIPLQGLKNGLYEVRHRQGLDWPYVTAAVAYADEGGAAKGVRVVLGHVAPVPWVAQEAAQALEGVQVQDETAAKAGEAAAQGASPLSRNAYKVRLVRTAVKRAALQAAGQPVEV